MSKKMSDIDRIEYLKQEKKYFLNKLNTLSKDYDNLYIAYEKLRKELETIKEDGKVISLVAFYNWYNELEWSDFKQAYDYYINILNNNH